MRNLAIALVLAAVAYLLWKWYQERKPGARIVGVGAVDGVKTSSGVTGPVADPVVLVYPEQKDAAGNRSVTYLTQPFYIGDTMIDPGHEVTVTNPGVVGHA